MEYKHLQLLVVLLPYQGIFKGGPVQVCSCKLGSSNDSICELSTGQVCIREVNPVQNCIGQVSACKAKELSGHNVQILHNQHSVAQTARLSWRFKTTNSVSERLWDISSLLTTKVGSLCIRLGHSDIAHDCLAEISI